MTDVSRWSLHRVRDSFSLPLLPALTVFSGSDSWREWRQKHGIPLGTPFLIAPDLTYDTSLNSFFFSTEMLSARPLTRIGYARDLKGFLDFLEHAREGTSWRDANGEDHRAYAVWRREDAHGPRVSPDTWNRGVSAVDRFYRWQLSCGQITQHPIPQRARRNGPWMRSQAASATTPASYSHAGRKGHLSWLPASSYRIWRDVGLRGYRSDGLPDPDFRGRWADRNASFTDLMVRTGLRLAEQSALTILDLPEIRSSSGYHRFWLPAAVAKGGSSRWVYIPTRILRNIHSYVAVDRRECIARAQSRGAYERRNANYLYLDERSYVRSTPDASSDSTHSLKLSALTSEERSQVLMSGLNGWEPASLWITEDGMPVASSTWKDMFRQANQRCARHEVDVSAHAHMLRHTFAVLTLEQLQRGHISALALRNPDQRTQYSRVFGDPLDWVRQRLGHKSVTTTQIYLHALEELEMETRMALVSDVWEDSRDDSLILTSESGADR